MKNALESFLILVMILGFSNGLSLDPGEYSRKKIISQIFIVSFIEIFYYSWSKAIAVIIKQLKPRVIINFFIKLTNQKWPKNPNTTNVKFIQSP